MTPRGKAIALAACVVALGIALPSLCAVAADAPAKAAWSRTLAAPSSEQPVAPILQPLPGGSLLVRNGAGAIAIDARGRTLWSMPNVDDAILDGDTIVFWRPDVIFAVRSRDAGVLWKRPCEAPPYLVAAGARLVTMCGGLSTVLRARDGSVLASRMPSLTTGPAHFQGARRLNDDYVLVTNFFDGAWMGNAYYVVDAHTGAFLWAQTDCDIVDVTPTTVSISPVPSMLPWGGTGLIRRRRLADGVVVSSRTYALPHREDTEGRGRLALSSAAAYVAPMYGSIFRFALGDTHRPQRVLDGTGFGVVTLAGAAFILGDARDRDGTLYIDRASGREAFTTRPLGSYAGTVSMRSPQSKVLIGAGAVRLGTRVAVADRQVVRLYDEFGAVEISADSQCYNPQIAASSDVLFTLCTQGQMPVILSAFRRH